MADLQIHVSDGDTNLSKIAYVAPRAPSSRTTTVLTRAPGAIRTVSFTYNHITTTTPRGSAKHTVRSMIILAIVSCVVIEALLSSSRIPLPCRYRTTCFRTLPLPCSPPTAGPLCSVHTTDRCLPPSCTPLSLRNGEDIRSVVTIFLSP